MVCYVSPRPYLLVFLSFCLFVFGAILTSAQGSLLVRGSENHMGYQESNLGRLYARHVPYSLYYHSSHSYFIFVVF